MPHWLTPIANITTERRVDNGELVLVYGELRRDPEKRKAQVTAAMRRYRARRKLAREKRRNEGGK